MSSATAKSTMPIKVLLVGALLGLIPALVPMLHMPVWGYVAYALVVAFGAAMSVSFDQYIPTDEIPYTVTARQDTGVTNAKLGIWLFLASEVMLFGALFSSLVILRVGNDVWGPAGLAELNIPLATFNTVVLISSSVTVILAYASLLKNDFAGFKRNFLFTIIGACIFLVAKSYEYNGKLSHGILPSSNNFFGIYFVMTFLHVVHVIGGLLVLIYLWGPGSKMWHSEPERFKSRVETIGLYWHFVDLVWIFLFPCLYLL